MAATDSQDWMERRQKEHHTVGEDVVPGAGMLGPQRGSQVEQQAVGQVEERRRGGQHSLHGPDKLLRLQRGRGGEEADAFPVEHVTAGCRETAFQLLLTSRGTGPKQVTLPRLVTERPF